MERVILSAGFPLQGNEHTLWLQRTNFKPRQSDSKSTSNFECCGFGSQEFNIIVLKRGHDSNGVIFLSDWPIMFHVSHSTLVKMCKYGLFSNICLLIITQSIAAMQVGRTSKTQFHTRVDFVNPNRSRIIHSNFFSWKGKRHNWYLVFLYHQHFLELSSNMASN